MESVVLRSGGVLKLGALLQFLLSLPITPLETNIYHVSQNLTILEYNISRIFFESIFFLSMAANPPIFINLCLIPHTL
ncbi:rCG50979 [Rattus norvegicus]|uniref:RCG50979 n=1 Tax=Rattus norvegicus TaxID=10116 RepID=A6KGC5_RAT|nr:rCG50979 [Rattus norvegicus]